ncbi:MAG: hypothetical protein QOI41_4718 [Myxococcales bacterium]|nr:hypothetical protein [Myxococcales bacterium]
MPYRVSAKPREPRSPDIDDNLLRKPWSSRALIVSLVYAPLLAWWLVMVEGGSGPRQLTPIAKVAIAVAFALWLVVLVILRARHQRVVNAALAKVEHETEASSRMRIADEPSSARVDDDAAIEQEHENDSPEQRGRSVGTTDLDPCANHPFDSAESSVARRRRGA